MKPYDGQPKPDFSEMRQPINMYMKSVDLAKIDAPIVAISVIPPYGPGGDVKSVAEKPIELRVSMADALYTVVHKTLIVMAKTIMTAFEEGVPATRLRVLYKTHIDMITKSCRIMPDTMKEEFTGITGREFVEPDEYEKLYFTLPRKPSVGYYMTRSLADYALRENHQFFLTNVEPRRIVRDHKGFKITLQKEFDRRWVIEGKEPAAPSSSSDTPSSSSINKSEPQVRYEGCYENSDAKDAFVLRLNRKTMTAELYPVDTCYKFSKVNAKSEGRTIDEVNKLMQEESRRDAEGFARLRKSQLIKKTTLSLVVMTVPGETTSAPSDAAKSKLQSAIDSIKATIKKDPFFRQYRINVYDHGGKNTDLWRESYDNVYHGAILVVDEDSKAGLGVAEHQAQKERYELLKGTPILAMRTSQVEKKMQDKKILEPFIERMQTEKEKLSKKKQLTFAFIGLRQPGNVEHLNKDRDVDDRQLDVNTRDLIKVVLGKRGPVRDTVKMEFKRKELDMETKKPKEEEYLITYMFGRKKSNLAVDGIIWAVDAADSEQLAASKEALKNEFQALKEAKKPILVIAKNLDYRKQISNIVNGDFAYWAPGSGLEEFEFNYEDAFQKWTEWKSPTMEWKVEKASLGRSSGSNFGTMGGEYSLGTDWLINNAGKNARGRSSKLSKVNNSSNMKLAQKFDKLAEKEKRSANPNASKSKYRFTNLLKKSAK